MIKAFVHRGNYASPDSVDISLVRYFGEEGSQPAQIMRLSGGMEGVPLVRDWEKMEPNASVTPTLRLQLTEAMALQEALSELRTGSGEYRALRADYDAERARVDLMIKSLLNAMDNWERS